MRIVSPGHLVLAAMLIALGIEGMSHGDFTAIWQPVPKAIPAREALAWLSAIVTLGSGIGLLWRRTASAAAGVLLACFALCFLLLRLPPIWHAPAVQDPWSGAGETAVYVAAFWVLYAGFSAEGRHMPRRRFARGEPGIRAARAVYGLSLIPFGIGHFYYLKESTTLVPGWLPYPEGWVQVTGVAYIAAGAAMLSGVLARLACTLSAVQMGLFTVMVWVPAVLAGPNAFQWSEFVISCVLTGCAWVVADSYRGLPWLSVRNRQSSMPRSRFHAEHRS